MSRYKGPPANLGNQLWRIGFALSSSAREVSASVIRPNKSLETRLRRLPQKEGLRILKSRVKRRRPDNLCRYQLLEDRRNIVVLGPKYDATLEDIAKYLTKNSETLEQK
jgi:hypothetical protein